MAKLPPSVDDLLTEIKLVTPAEYHEPFFNDPDGAIATFRGAARALHEYSVVVGRSASRQFFLRPPALEPASVGSRAQQTITIERTESQDSGLILSFGSIVTEGPRGRTYRSANDVEWLPFDPDPQRTVTLICDLIGEPGNLDFFADDDGNLVLPEDPTLPGTDVVDLADLSQGRSDTGGLLTVNPGSPSILTDDGNAPTFSPGDPGLYVRINFAGNADNIGRVLRITDFNVSTVEDPPGSGLFPRFVLLDDLPQPHLIGSAQADDGGVFTDFTAAAQSADADDVQLLPALPLVNDAFYFGSDVEFSQIDITITTKLIGDVTLVWEAWLGVWTPITVTDETLGFTIEGTNSVIISEFPGWLTTTINGVAAFYIRARVSAVVIQNQQPLAGRCVVYIPDPMLADPLDVNGDGQINWTILDAADLGVEIVAMTAPSGGRDDDLGLKLRERKVIPAVGETDDQLRQRASRFPDVISPELLERKILRILEPWGLTAAIKDVGYDGPGYPSFSGLFWDVDPKFAPEIVCAWDLYEPGDLFPENQTFYPLSVADTLWHFWLCLPPPTLGEFGAAWDEGPAPTYWDQLGTWIDSAWDFAFLDGYPALSGAIYKEVAACVDEARAAGIRFTVIQDSTLQGCP